MEGVRLRNGKCDEIVSVGIMREKYKLIYFTGHDEGYGLDRGSCDLVGSSDLAL